MALRRHERRVRLKRWPSRDWEYAPLGYRFLKANFVPLVRAATRLHVKGRQNVPREGPVLLAVNHFSWADPVVVSAALERPAYYLAKERLFVNPAARWFFASMGQIPVNRQAGGNEDAIQAAVDLLERGVVVGVFPEGTRSRYGELKRGKTGVARIAARSGAPIVPIAVATADFWPKHAGIPSFGERVYLNVGEPMRLDLKPADAEDRQRMRDATDDVMARIRALLDEATAAKAQGVAWEW
jgi:1-acyl-sn-glycerol-3-phosphate acyltransferase